MSEEQLQADAAPETGDQQADTGTADLAPVETGENQSNKSDDDDGGKVEFTPEQQAVFDKAINRQHSKFRDAERANEETQALLSKANERIGQFEADIPAPVIPPMPDSFDDNHDELIKVRDDAIRAQATHEAQQSTIAQAAQNAANDRALIGQRQAQADADTLNTNAAKQGIKIEDLQVAAKTVGDYHLDPALVVELMTNEDGPVMIAHLAANPMELDALRQLPLGQAFGVLHGKIRTAAQALKPKTSDAPDPPELLGGDGKPEGDNRPMIAGARFE